MKTILFQTEDGRYKAMCPQDGTWAFISEAQYRGEAPLKCPHPECGHEWTFNYAGAKADADAAAKPRDQLPDHF